MMTMSARIYRSLLSLIFVTIPPSLWAQAAETGAKVDQDTAGQDVNPTKPVFWNFRNEYHNLRGSFWDNVIIVRVDKVVLKRTPGLGGKRGVILRFDMPFPIVHAADGNITGGLGDLYAQFVYVPFLTRTFALASGSGLVLPTATDERLGSGKWQISPILAPVWFIPKHGFFVLKLQDYKSFAGDVFRPDVNYFLFTPILSLSLKHRWWIQLDGECKTNWEQSGHTGYKSGFLLGRMFGPHLGLWVKPEVPWGLYREGNFTIKTSVFWVR